MDVSPQPSPTASRALDRRNLLVILLVIFAFVCLPVLVVVGLYVYMLNVTSVFAPTQSVGFEIGKVTCLIDDATGNALVEVPTTATESIGQFRVEPLKTEDVILVGVGSLVSDQSLLTLDAAAARDLRLQLDDDDDKAHVPIDPTNVILEFTNASDAPVLRLSTVTLRWSGGEPVYLQDVPLDLVWTASGCRVSSG